MQAISQQQAGLNSRVAFALQLLGGRQRLASWAVVGIRDHASTSRRSS
jgi:hypothetical protein